MNSLRPAIHFTPERNWMNDPNGLIHVDGVWHLFFQYNPLENHWGNMSWGHATSTDLVHWTETDIAIRFADDEAIYSGSVVNDAENTSGLGAEGEGPLVAIYTSAYTSDLQAQSLAVSHDRGTTWTKFDGNPVLTRNTHAFRDPKVFRYGGADGWWVLISVEADDEEAHIFTSHDLRTWHPSDRIAYPSREQLQWECPDLFPLQHGDEDVWVLVMSVNPGEKGRGSATRYQLGEFDGRTFRPRADACWRLMDHGRDFYAAATFTDAPDGRRISMGWMSNWQYAAAFPTPTWRGSMALPRELFLVEENDELRLGQRVARELATRENHELAIDLSESREAHGGEVPAAYRLVIEADVPDDAVLTIVLAADRNHGTTLTYSGSDRKLELDRRRSGSADVDPTFPSTSTAVVATAGMLDLDIYVDATSVEVFAAGGTVAITDCILPNDGARAVRLHARYDAMIRKATLIPLT